MRIFNPNMVSTIVRQSESGFAALLFATISVGVFFVASLASPCAFGQNGDATFGSHTYSDVTKSRSSRQIQDLPTTVMIVAAEQFPNVKSPDAGSSTLASAKNDALLARRFLGADDAHAYELSPNSPGGRATLENFRKYVERIAEEAPFDSRFILYVTSHGVWDSTGRFHLLTEDSQVEYGEDLSVKSVSNAISGDDLAKMIASIKSKEVVLIVDACYASGAFQASYFNSLFQDETKKRSFYGIFSANNEPSQVREDVGVSVFTYYFDLAVFLGDVNLDGYVSIDEVFNFLATRVRSFSMAQSEEYLRRRGIGRELATKSSSFQNAFDPSSYFQGAIKDEPLFHEPTRVVAQFEGSVPAFRAPKLNVQDAFDYLSKGVAETIKLNKLNGRRGYVKEFGKQLNEDADILPNNSVGVLFAKELEQRVEKFLGESTRPIMKSLAVKPKSSPDGVPSDSSEQSVKISGASSSPDGVPSDSSVQKVKISGASSFPDDVPSDSSEQDVMISGAYYDLPQRNEVLVRCDVSANGDFFDPFTIHVDRETVDLLLDPIKPSDYAPPAEGVYDGRNRSEQPFASLSSAETFNGGERQVERPITPIVESPSTFKNPEIAPLKISISKKTGKSSYREIYSSNKTAGDFRVKKGDVVKISATNQTDKVFAALVLADGLNIIAQSSDVDRDRLATPYEHLRKGRYFICKPNYKWEWDSWLQYQLQSKDGISSLRGHEFKIVAPPDSMAHRVNESQNVGEIRILIYEATDKKESTRGAGLGFGTGNAVNKRFVESTYRAASDEPIAYVVLKYYDAEK